jgi:hypothetical protein
MHACSRKLVLDLTPLRETICLRAGPAALLSQTFRMIVFDVDWRRSTKPELL